MVSRSSSRGFLHQFPRSQGIIIIFLSEAAYLSSDDLVQRLESTESGWTPLSNVDLDMSALDFGEGLFDSNYLFDKFNFQAFVAYKGDTLALVFRGTDLLSVQDWIADAFGGLIDWQVFYGYYDKLIRQFWEYFHANGFENVLVRRLNAIDYWVDVGLITKHQSTEEKL